LGKSTIYKENMNILVTGGCGFIGTNLVKMLLSQGHTVFNLDYLTYASNKHLATINNPHYIHYHDDILNKQLVGKILKNYKIDHIMHLAAESHVDRSINSPVVFIETNIVGTHTLLEEFRTYVKDTGRTDHRFLHVSTDEVFGSLAFDSPRFLETSAYDPHSPYSASKASSDHLVRAYHTTYGLPTLITNCSNNYGPHQHPEKFIPTVIRKCLNNENIPVYGDGTNIRDWIHVEDHCRGLIRVLERGVVGETYLIGGDDEVNNNDMASLIIHLVNNSIKWQCKTTSRIELVSDRPGHDLRYAINSNKIKFNLDWKKEWDLQVGLIQTIQWYIDNGFVEGWSQTK